MSYAKYWKTWVSNLQKDEINLETVSLKDLSRISGEAKRFGIDLVLIGGYAVRAYTKPRSWRFTKDIDFVTTRKDLTALYGVLKLLGYDFEKTEFGIKGNKRVGQALIKLDVAVDKVIDWSTRKEYPLPNDIFSKAREVSIEASFEENKELKVSMPVALIEDVVVMKLMTERPKDRFDAIAIITDYFEKIDLSRFVEICKKSRLDKHIKSRLESILADTKKGVVKKLWREFTAREFIREQEVVLKERLNKLLEKTAQF